MHSRPYAVLILVSVTGIAFSGCHPGNAEAKQLRGACDAGDVTACNRFAIKLQKGEYVLRDDTRAAELFEKACTGGVGEGCASLGVVYQRGRGVKRDSARALTLFEQGCERGAMDGCTRLGLQYQRGAGVTKDFARAATLFSAHATAATSPDVPRSGRSTPPAKE